MGEKATRAVGREASITCSSSVDAGVEDMAVEILEVEFLTGPVLRPLDLCTTEMSFFL